MTTPFNEQYYMDGQSAKVSNYENYEWKPDATLSMCSHLKRYLGIQLTERVLEIGCARGFYTHALRMLEVDAYGYDISEWAVANCHPEVKPYVSNHLNGGMFDVTWSKDCLEHIAPKELGPLITHLCKATRRKIFAIVPLAKNTNGEYVHPKEENDVTHVNRWTLHDWIDFLQNCSSSFSVTGGYHYPGLKPGSFEVKHGYGFLSMDRI